jgi:predicted DNA-binding transcriptional regulator AlpA
MEYTFTLKYQLTGNEGDADALVERLGEAGCNDALVGTGQVGRLGLEFTREAKSARAAMRSALADVKRAVPTARLIEAAPDFVGLSDLAEILRISRQAVRKLMLAHSGNFPAPVHEGNASIWHLAELLEWLKAKGSYALDQTLIDVAQAALEVNLFMEALRLQEFERRAYKLDQIPTAFAETIRRARMSSA